MVLLLWLVAYVAIDAAMQGKLTKLFRLYIPVVHQPTINLCLHVGAPLLYVLYSWQVCGPEPKALLLAVAVRLCLFDVVLNLVKGDPVFAVGYSALTDRLLRKLAGARASWLSGAVRVAAVAAAALLLSSCRTSRNEPAAEPWGVAPVAAVPVAADGGAPGGKVPDSLGIKERIQKETEKKTASTGLLGIFGRKKPERNPKEGRVKYKNVTFTTVVGNDNQLQTVGKKSQAPVGQAAPNASLNQAASKTGIAQAGENLKAEQKQAEVKPWYGFLLGPVGIVLGLAVAAALVYGFVQYRRARSIV